MGCLLKDLKKSQQASLLQRPKIYQRRRKTPTERKVITEGANGSARPQIKRNEKEKSNSQVVLGWSIPRRN